MGHLCAVIITAAALALTACAAAPPAPAPGVQGLIGDAAPVPVTGDRNPGQVPCAMVQPSGGEGQLCDLPPGGGGIVFAP